MKTVVVPEPVTLHDLSQNPPVAMKDENGDEITYTIHTWLLRVVIPDPAMGRGYKADRGRVALDKAFRNAEPGTEVQVEDEHLDGVKKAIEKPEGTFPGGMAMQLFPFAAAFMEAK